MTGRPVPMRWWHIAPATALDAELFGRTAWSAETFWAELARPETHCYAVLLGPERDGDPELLGYAGLRVVDGTADVQTVAVAPAAQGRGRGAVLLDWLLEQARRRAAREVMLEVAAQNTAAQSLYRQAGFEQIALRRGYYGPGQDALIMRRALLHDHGGGVARSKM